MTEYEKKVFLGPVEVDETDRLIRSRIVRTPMLQLDAGTLSGLLGERGALFAKCEFLQHGGSFKLRGVLASMLRCNDAPGGPGVVAVSAGNHGIAVAHAAQSLGLSARVYMPLKASPFRVDRCRRYGAEVRLVENASEGFSRANTDQTNEGRRFIHPYDGAELFSGVATIGKEMLEDVADLDVVIASVGGGGLLSGIGSYIKQVRPGCRIIGVEPVGANKMKRSLSQGKICSIETVDTIADSLGAPRPSESTFALFKEYVDDVVLVSDDDMRSAMSFIAENWHFCVEPAAAAAVAAMSGSIGPMLLNQKVGLVLCGANISAADFSENLAGTSP